jgi:hypothetical protein
MAAGGKVVKVDRVEWNVIPDATTAARHSAGARRISGIHRPTTCCRSTRTRVVVGKLAPFGNFHPARQQLFRPSTTEGAQALAYA